MRKETKYVSYLDYEGQYKGIFGWIFSTDHKRLGLLYLYAIALFFFVGAILGLTMRVELATPGETIMKAQAYNGVFTVHGVIMIFMVVIPGLSAVFGNFFLPLMIGAKDVAFPKLNRLTWWILIAGSILAIASQFLREGPPDTGWTFYAPYSTKTGTSVIIATTAAFVLGFASILTGLNFIVTIHRLRAPGMKFFNMPLFPWALYAASWIQLLATPVVGITLVMLIFERLFGIGFFNPDLGGDPILFQHLFWIYSHPAVYIMILPAMGVITEVIPTFCQRRIYGYKAIAISSLAIAAVGFFVWGHHMYTSGMSEQARWFFSLLTFIVAVPSAIKVFNWIATMYRGSINLQAPFLYALFFIFLFIIGGTTGLILGAVAPNVQVHDTSFVVAHFHYIIFGGMGFAFFSGLHYWFPKMYGRMYNLKAANWGAIILFIGFNLLYFPQFIIGYQGMPRRYYDYLPQFQWAQTISLIGGIILFIGFFVMVGNLVRGAKKGAIAPANPWNGTTLEWTVPSPPPVENFDEDPIIKSDPYDYK
ncbi:MAG: cytochrome c oxidase subunit I [Porphyromonadaceae bacterium CG2_30_38_12]|nr:MAG: cytochrome c oxidase subunit I [Porphyromonadaceae bacterium CG2_30_38_12]